MPSDLIELFERTLPTDEVVLHRLAQAEHRMAQARHRLAETELRRTRESRALRWWVPSWGWTIVGGVTCAAAATLVLWYAAGSHVSSLPAQTIRPEADQFLLSSPSDHNPSDHRAAKGLDAHQNLVTFDQIAKFTPQRVNTGKPNPPKPTQEGKAPGLASAPPASWESAAQAMRAGDRAETVRILSELSRSEDPETRDGARLVQLRSLIGGSSGGPDAAQLSDEARTQLETLAQSGATASIRASARTLLEQTGSWKTR
jgi:hypothetical protein